MSYFARLWSSSQRNPTVKVEENSDEINPPDSSITDHLNGTQENAEQDVYDEVQNHDTWEGFGAGEEQGEEEPVNASAAKEDKAKKKKKRKRKGKDAVEELEVETPQLGDDNSLEENSLPDVYGESAINAQIEEPSVEERFVVEDPAKPKRARKTSGSALKRKRAPKSKAVISPEDDAAAIDEVGDEAVAKEVVAASQPRKTVKHVKPTKSRQAIVDPDLKPESMENGEPEAATLVLSAGDLSELPQRIEKTKKRARRFSGGPSWKSQEDDTGSAAMLHQPLTPAYVPPHIQHAHLEPDTQEANLAVSSQLQTEARSTFPAEPVDDEVAEDEEPKQPSKKALGKRKAVDEPLSRDSNKKSKRGKDKEHPPQDLRSFGFMTERLPQMAAELYQETDSASPEPPSNSQRPSWNAVNNAIEADDGNESKQSLFVPDREEREQSESPESPEVAPKSSGRKRRLPVHESGPTNSTPTIKSRPTPAKPRAKTPKTPKAKDDAVGAKKYPVGTFTKGKLSTEELDAVSSAVESYRIHHSLTQHEVNELIQTDAQRSVPQEMWKSICDEVPNIPRRNVQNTCRRKFHNFEARGAWTEEQDEELRRVYDEHPGKWKKIGEALNRFPEDIRDRWRNYLVCGDTLKKDAWDIEEEEHLRAAVRQCVQEARKKNPLDEGHGSLVDEESLIDWQKVSENMGRTRSRLQCSNKWKKLKDRAEMYVDDPVAKMPISESWRMEEAASQAKTFSAKEKLELLQAIRDSGAAREGKIPWQTIKDDLSGQGKRMAWKYCFRKLRDCIPDHEEIDFKVIVAHLVEVFETAAPGEPHGFNLPIEVFQPYVNPNKKQSQAVYRQRQRDKSNNGEGLSTPSKRRSRARKQDQSEDSGDGAEEGSTVKRRRVRDRMLKEGESQESANSQGEASVDIRDEVVQSFKSIRRTPKTNGKRVIRKSKQNQALSEEKVIEDPSDDDEALVNGNASEPNEDAMDIDHEETYTTTGGPAADGEPDDDASDEEEEHEEFDRGANTNGYHTEGSPDLDTPVQGRSFQKLAAPLRLNCYSLESNSNVSSDDDDMSDIPAHRVPRQVSIEL